MANIDGSGFSQFDRLLDLVRRTRELLDTVADEGELPEGGAAYLEGTTLPHLEGVQSGFHGWLRSDAADAAELRFLLQQVAALRVAPAETEAERRAAAAEMLMELRLADGRPRPSLTGIEPWHLAALSHARVVLALVPKLPEEDVRFPAGRRTYADIPTPRGPAELSERIAELERELWKAVTGRPGSRVDPAFRRTYGFFDTADRLGFRAMRGAA
ncbi:MAG: hypothetical protein ACJ77B_00595 [Chloroflexota bacterium]